ncbi:type I restriction endonuclease subunit R [Candidatus Dojkabacteria bacterium]|nr:type I restriction endonuclease subunit R [Candidatus Dojkabacteria bacterium]
MLDQNNTLNKKESGFEDVIFETLTQNQTLNYRARVDSDYDKANCIDFGLLVEFLQNTQPEKVEKLRNIYKELFDRNFSYRLNQQIKLKGVVEVLRKGIEDMGVQFTLMYPHPSSSKNPNAQEQYNQNITSIIRQVHFSQQSNESVDLVIFVNGIPVLTIELKNPLSGQTYQDAIWQYRYDRSPKEELFTFTRCMVHFAMDSEQVYMCTKLDGEKSVFLPFNKGNNEQAGNPENPSGYRTAYMWEEIFQKDSLINIIESFASKIVEKDEETGKEKVKQIFPRYHQLDCVRKLLQDAKLNGTGKKYLIQHSAGSGKSNSITWLAHQLVELHDSTDEDTTFDSVIVVTDRKVLDQQIRINIRQFAQVDGVVEAITEGSQHLRIALESGKKIIITTVQKFPYIVNDIANLPSKKFALIIDEAHSSQSGETSRNVSMALADKAAIVYGENNSQKDIEDILNEMIVSKKLLPNASYFAFTATPKNKTLELFGIKQLDGSYRAYHVYSMQQAIQEKFILDILLNYTTFHTYYSLIKKVESDPEFDKKVAKKVIYKFLQTNPDTIEKKARIMLEHFKNSTLYKIGGKAKAMVVAGSRKNAVEYYFAFAKVCEEMNLPFTSIVAYTGEIDGQTEDKINGFSISLRSVKKKLANDDLCKFLIVAEKFQTGFDEPLLHTMYVDRILSGVTAVQTLSRLNRVMPPKKTDTFVLDFVNIHEDIQKSFEPYYKSTILSEGTDPNKLFDLKDAIKAFQIYTDEEVLTYVVKCLERKSVVELHPILDSAVTRFNNLDEEHKYDLKAKVTSFIRLYAYLSQIAPFESVELEKLYIFLSDLNKKLVIDYEKEPIDDIINSIDLDSIRIQKESDGSIGLKGDETLEPIPTEMRGGKSPVEKDRLSRILEEMNERFGGIDFGDGDKVRKTFGEIADDVKKDPTFIKATQNADRQNSWITFEKVLNEKFQNMININFSLYKKYSDDPDFKKFMSDKLFEMVWTQPTSQSSERNS